ncbi:MAG: Endospore coat-associated protein YheD [Firmicutes bacterium]|nr:Endospore coat-associated protein YheD [Bacillota bacterium]
MSGKIVVGIMSSRKENAGLPFSEGLYFKQLIRAANSIAVRAFVFCPLDIDWRARSVWGYTHSPGLGGWSHQRFPLPDVVYDRLFPPRGHMANILFTAARRLRRQKGVVFFGRALRGKWEVYRSVRKHSDLSPHIPDTRRLSSLAALRHMLVTHRYVFIKPDLGSQGKGVMQVRVTNSGLVCRGRDSANRPFAATVDSVAAVLGLAKSRSQRCRLLVQQGLHLNHFKGSTFDIRSVVQKDEAGKWAITGTAARIGQRGSITSNLHGGGRAMRTEALLRAAFPLQWETILSKAHSLCLSIPSALDQELGRFGELGLDLGVDKDGKVWLIEANSKPGRKVFLKIKARDLRRRSILRPMQYCKFLAEAKRGEQICAI